MTNMLGSLQVYSDRICEHGDPEMLFADYYWLRASSLVFALRSSELIMNIICLNWLTRYTNHVRTLFIRNNF